MAENKKIKICICGGGNLAHAFAGELGKNKEKEVNILTRRPDNWNSELDVYYDKEFSHKSFLAKITNDYNILKNSNVIVLTLPANVRYEYLLKIKDYINPNTLLISAPSTGGINFLFDKYFPQNKYVCMQRVPYICRIIEYGHSVRTDVKKQISVYYSKNCTADDKLMINSIIEPDLVELNSIYTLFLSNSNPILHIAGMMEILNGDYPADKIYPLYDKWSDYASDLCIKMDNELSEVMEKLNVKEYKTLYEHYEVGSISGLTQKLKSIPSFKQVMSPMKEENGKYIIDKDSRYIAEDLPFGTCFIKLFAQKLGIKTPSIDFCIQKLQPFLDLKLTDNSGNLNTDALISKVSYIKEIEEII